MAHSKKGIRVVGSDQPTWTSQRGARRLIARGLAEWMPDGTLQMVAEDHRLSCEPRSTGDPAILELVRQFPVDLHYQDDRAVLKFWPEMAIPGIAA